MTPKPPVKELARKIKIPRGKNENSLTNSKNFDAWKVETECGFSIRLQMRYVEINHGILYATYRDGLVNGFALRHKREAPVIVSFVVVRIQLDNLRKNEKPRNENNSSNLNRS